MTAPSLLIIALATAAASTHGPFTNDFVKFLEENPERNQYLINSFHNYGEAGTFGGRKTEDEEITRQPVLFIHGNSDSALHFSKMATGWTKSVEHFKASGYSQAELYGLTYGPRDINFSLNSRISCHDLLGLRRFIEAILEYTEAEKIDIIAHSMGVTLARMAVKGGMVHLTDESCNLGESLAPKVDALVAISGANYGMCMCLMAGIAHLPACGQTGFAPGKCGRKEGSIGECMDQVDECNQADYASVLNSVNNDEKEADFVVSLWSNEDTILGLNNRVWGRKTSVVPNSDLTHAYDGLDHFQTKDDTVSDQLILVSKHSLHKGRERRHH